MNENKVTVISNVTLFNDLTKTVTLTINNGVITKINPFRAVDFLSSIDATGLVVFPGMVDSHTHMRDLDLSYKEDYASASLACAHGGITTFLDMPNTMPPTLTNDILNEKRKRASLHSIVNYGFHFGASALNNSDEIRQAKNIASLKIFMNETTGNLLIEDDDILNVLFASAPNTITLHAEGSVMFKKAFALAKKYSKNLYFCHIALEEELQTLEEIKNECIQSNLPFKVYGEVTPHHLYFSQNDIDTKEKGQILCMKPGLKTKKDTIALLNALKSGLIDTVGTDHAPHTLQEKMQKTTYGVPGVESAFPFLLSLAHKNEISYSLIADVFSKNPSKIFKIKNKGVIAQGLDADLVLINPKKQTVLTKENIVSKCGFSPFEGIAFLGKVEKTFVAGNLVYDEGKYNTSIKAREVEFE